MFLANLVELGTIDEQLACFLQAAVQARMNIVVAGATDAGKTTLLRALINAVPPAERLITVERSLELGLRRHPELHPDVVELEEVLPDADGNGGLYHPGTGAPHPPAQSVQGFCRRGAGPGVVEMLSRHVAGEQRVPLDHPCPVRDGCVREAGTPTRRSTNTSISRSRIR